MKAIKLSMFTYFIAICGMSIMFTSIPKNVNAETKLTLVYPFPDFLQYTKNCKALVAAINKRGKGLIKIDILPFNSIKMFQQAPAVSKGRVDLNCLPAAFYARAIPELEAISTASSSIEQARKSGGIDMLDEIHQKHFKVKYLGWTGDGNKFRFYMRDAPKFAANGLVDFKGLKLRGNPVYGAFIEAMGGTQHSLPAPATYGALEKGVVDAAAWATIGLRGLKWDKMLRQAVEPDFYATDLGWIMNLKKWNGLSKEAQNILQSTVKEFELSNRDLLAKMHEEEKAALLKGGMKFHQVPNPDKYLKLSVDSAYQRMITRLEKAKRSTDHIPKLRAAWQQ